MIIGYARVSTANQDLDKQVQTLKEYGCERIYSEHISGVKEKRPELERMIDALRIGDTLIITELTRLGRSTKDLFTLIEKIQNAGANVKSLKESWVDTSTPIGAFMFTVMAGVSQFEKDLISVRTKEALSISRKNGKIGEDPR